MPIWMSIQYLRAAAALVVVWCHSYLQLEKIADIQAPSGFNGRSGVDLFFVISGFIMWVTTYGSGQNSTGFWRRRLIRIIPIYWLCTLGMVVLLVAAPSLFGRPHLDFGHIVQSLLFIPHVDPFRPGEFYPLLQVGWTLNFEMFFYLIFGFCLMLRPERRVVAAVLTLGGLVTLGTIFRSEGPLWATYTNPLLLEFMAGVVIGYAFTSGWRPDAGFGCALILLAILGFFGLNQGLHVEPSDWRVLCWGLPAVLLVAGIAAVERTSGIVQLASLQRLGDASYAIYLSHPFTLGALGWFSGRFTVVESLPPSAFVAVAMLASLLVGLTLHFWIERPLIRCLRSCWHDKACLPRRTMLVPQGGHIGR